MEIVERYLDEVCGYVASVPHRRAVRRELSGHMEDSMESACRNGCGKEEAARRAIEEMGPAREAGRRFNDIFSVRPDYKLLIYILGIFCLYTAAGMAIHFSYAESGMTLFSYSVCAGLFLLLKRFDMEGKYYLIKYLYFGTLLLLWAVSIFAEQEVRRECMSAGGVILLFCISFFVYRLHKYHITGLIAAVLLFLLPVPLFFRSAAYTAFLLYMTAGVYTFGYYIAKGRPLKFFAKAGVALTAVGLIGITAVLCSSAVFMKWNLREHFFLRDGSDHSAYLSEHFREYPLAAGISRYGYWTLAVYLILMLLVLAELIRMKRKVHHIWGRNVLNCIVLLFSIKSIFAVLLNLGFPFIRSCMLPFAGFGSDQVANLLLVVMAEYVYCFGDAVFADCSFFEENRLLDMEDGYITLHYRTRRKEQELMDAGIQGESQLRQQSQLR